MKSQKEWKRQAKLEDKSIGTLVLPRKPRIGSKVLVPVGKISIHARVLKIDDDCVYLEKE